MKTKLSIGTISGTWTFLQRKVINGAFNNSISNEITQGPISNLNDNINLTNIDYNNSILALKQPCERESDGSYKFPINLFKDYIRKILGPNYSLNIQGKRLNVSEICNKFFKGIWCASSDNEIKRAFEQLVDDISHEIIAFARDYNLNISKARDQIKTLRIKTDKEATKFLQNESIKLALSGIGGINKDSCLCGGKYETFCCDPDLDKEFCYCSDGSLRNICEPCYKNIELILPHVLNYPNWISYKCEWGGQGDYRQRHQKNSEVFITVETLGGKIIENQNNIKITSDVSSLKSIKNRDDDFERYLENIKVPLNVPCKITIVIIGPCMDFKELCCYKSGTFRGKWTGSIIYYPHYGSPYLVEWIDVKKECVPCKL